MKNARHLITLLFSSIALLIILQSSSGGRASVDGQGNTDAPGDATLKCYNCHSSNDKTVEVSIAVLDSEENEVQTYIPGENYNVIVSVIENDPDLIKYGFQMIGLLAPLEQSGESIDTWTEESEDLRVFTLNNGRQYIEHNKPSESNQMIASFTAPESGTGSITLYACGNAVDGANGSSGDQASCTEIEITEDTRVNSFEAGLDYDINIFPNPTSDFLRLSFNSGVNRPMEWTLYNTSGRIVRKQTIKDMRNSSVEWPIYELPSGLYYLEFSSGMNKILESVVIQ